MSLGRTVLGGFIPKIRERGFWEKEYYQVWRKGQPRNNKKPWSFHEKKKKKNLGGGWDGGGRPFGKRGEGKERYNRFYEGFGVKWPETGKKIQERGKRVPVLHSRLRMGNLGSKV